MKTTEELLPCPNDCKHGLVNVFEYPSGNLEESRDLYQVACACGVRGPMKDSRKAAVAAWNALPHRADIERVERERDWLARQLAAQSGHSVAYWRKLAHRAVEGE